MSDEPLTTLSVIAVEHRLSSEPQDVPEQSFSNFPVHPNNMTSCSKASSDPTGLGGAETLHSCEPGFRQQGSGENSPKTKCSGAQACLHSLPSFWTRTLWYGHFCGGMGAVSLRFISSEPRNKHVVKRHVSAHWPRTADPVPWIQKITRPTVNLSTQMLARPKVPVLILSCEQIFLLPKGNLQTEDRLAKEIRASVIRKPQATMHLASVRDEWERLQKYFTTSLLCEREPQGGKKKGIFKFLYYPIQLCVSA